MESQSNLSPKRLCDAVQTSLFEQLRTDDIQERSDGLRTDSAEQDIHNSIQKLLAWNLCSPADNCVWIACNQQTDPILQHGPECGIVALCMGLNILTQHLEVKHHDKGDILRIAKERGFTLQGEMFSAVHMQELSSFTPGINGAVLHGNMVDNMNVIMSHISNGWPVLVPYDKDGNCEPCCRKGHKAHWAVITGFIIRWEKNSGSTQLNQCSGQSGMGHIISPQALGPSMVDILSRVPISHVFLLARQGKSTHLHPWRYKALSDSNANLLELGSNILQEIQTFVVPEGGTEEDLCNKVILLRT